MNVQVHHVIVHSKEQVREIIAEAERIADEAAERGQQWDLAYQQACTLLGQRFSLAIPQEQVPINLPAMAIPRGRH